MSNQTNFSNTNPTTPNPGQNQVGQQPGVSGTQGTPNGATSNAGSGDGQMTLEEAMELIRQRDNDINRLKSTYDKKLNETDRQAKQRMEQLEAQMRQVATANMDETAKTKYDLEYTQKQLEQVRQETTKLQAERESWQQLLQTRDQMIQSGIPAEKLDMTNQETLASSAWTYLIQDREEKRRRLEEFETSRQPQQQQRQQFQTPQPQTQQRVITNSAGQPAPQVTSMDAIKASMESAMGRKITDEEFFRLAERSKIDLSQIR